MNGARGKIIVGMSGGVDSSVAALLLLEQGHDVAGLFMKNWDEDDGTEYCTALADLADAQAVCDTLGIKLYTANFAAEYWDRVFAHFLQEYRAGRTPNPDILCNREIKFNAFLDYARLLGAERIATGHYARLDHGDGQTRLCKALDGNKDQSYFLSAVNEAQLIPALFPLGELSKPEVRALAARHGFVTHDKKDSTGICFIGERRFRDFLSTYLPAQPGRIETPQGQRLGTHHGLMYHTLGQREGLGIGGVRGGNEEPWYVAAKDMERNVLIVVQGQEHPLLYTNTLTLTQLDWINARHPALPLYCTAKTRYRQADQDCEVRPLPSGGIEVRFTQPQRAVTPGQQLVLYLGECCLGGGVIAHTWNR
ncbi:MAG: tRNA 2-thiouridine(34) synthase MnmA [Pseudomonadales bacterium]|jgi:tRNA-specific 2-thiouridylase|nr:tRNA 2-thiouridine(34) synthase MnmA [Pseudomonadales bacterium]